MGIYNLPKFQVPIYFGLGEESDTKMSVTIRALARAPVATSDLLFCNFLLKVRPEMSKFYELAREPLYKL